jgi:hypothetical protein
MWDEARALGPTMLPNEYYSLKNVRMKLSRAGCIEAKLVEPKIQKLDPDDVNPDSHLKALISFVLGLWHVRIDLYLFLRRLKPHDDMDEEEIELKLIGLARDKEYLSSVVEV